MVIGYIIGMVENGGGIVYRGGEGEWEGNEVIVDNDRDGEGWMYEEIKRGKGKWKRGGRGGLGEKGLV